MENWEYVCVLYCVVCYVCGMFFYFAPWCVGIRFDDSPLIVHHVPTWFRRGGEEALIANVALHFAAPITAPVLGFFYFFVLGHWPGWKAVAANAMMAVGVLCGLAGYAIAMTALKG